MRATLALFLAVSCAPLQRPGRCGPVHCWTWRKDYDGGVPYHLQARDATGCVVREVPCDDPTFDGVRLRMCPL